MDQTRIVIAGAGFGGFYAARSLQRAGLNQRAQVTVVNETNFMLYTPLLPGAAGGTLDPRHVVVPLRSQLKQANLIVGGVTGADPQQRTLGVRRKDGTETELGYDHLVVALGSVSRTLPIPGLAEHGIGLKSLADATGLRNRVLNCLDIAESLESEQARAEYLGFVFVGAGYAGLEGLAELQDFAGQALRDYPHCRAQGLRWLLVEAQDRIMGEAPPSLSAFAAKELQARGIEIATGTTLEAMDARGAVLSNGARVKARTVVWTAGVRPSPAVASLGMPLDRTGRIPTDREMRVLGRPGVWAIGDCAAIPDPARRGEPCPPTAQHAIRQGRLVAQNIVASLEGREAKPLRYRTKGVVAELGNNRAIAITLGLRWRGRPAWLIARTYHLLLMPGLGRKLRLLADWNIALLFGRDASSPGVLGTPQPLEALTSARAPSVAVNPWIETESKGEGRLSV
ncbi:MAG: NAD(P)/FAD-dependent oxidoreductase [Solirubrobacteraceae bacterium]